MPHELRDYGPVLRFLEGDEAQNLMLLRSLRLGPRPGFSVVVDHPDDVGAAMLVVRPDWRKAHAEPVTVQVVARSRQSALELLAWLTRGARYSVQAYQPELGRLMRQLMKAEGIHHRVQCQATPAGFHPSKMSSMVREIPREEWSGLTGMLGEDPASAHRLFGFFRGDQVHAIAVLEAPDTEWVSVRRVFTRKESRMQGLGSAVLSAATEAGLSQQKAVTCPLCPGDLASMRMLSNLGFAPVCREWILDGPLAQ